jgi:hypothetical protein
VQRGTSFIIATLLAVIFAWMSNVSWADYSTAREKTACILCWKAIDWMIGAAEMPKISMFGMAREEIRWLEMWLKKSVQGSAVILIESCMDDNVIRDD